MQAPEHDKKTDCGDVAATAKLGREGEISASLYLTSSGYEVREKNVRCGRGEIDIIAYDRKEKMIVFVEVKTRSFHNDAYPIRTALDRRKRRALHRTVATWVQEQRYEGPGRIDLLSIYRGVVVEHIMDIGSDFF